MKNLRSKVFETNSSSTHSLSIYISNKVELYDTLIPDDNGIITLIGGEFGFMDDKINDVKSKANFVAALTTALPDENSYFINMISNVIKSHTGAKDVIVNLSKYNEINYDCNITKLSRDIFESEQSLKNFIFNPKSWLFSKIIPFAEIIPW